MYFIGVDIGSSYVKLVVFDLDKKIIADKKVLNSLEKINNAKEGRFEIDAQKLTMQIIELINESLDNFNEVVGIVFSTQMHGFILESGTDITPAYISWQDQRCLEKMSYGVSWMEYLRELVPENMMLSTGVHIKSSLALSNLYVILKEQNINPEDCKLYTLGSYVIHKLTGNNCCHIQNAAATGMVNVIKKCWDQNIIKKVGFEGIDLPQIVNGFEVCGTYSYSGRKISIFPDFGDQQVTILGCNPDIEDIIINIGTAAQMSSITNSFNPGFYEVRPYFEKCYLNTVSNLPGGRNLNVLIQFIKEIGEMYSNRNLEIGEVWKAINLNRATISEDLKVGMQFFNSVEGGPSRGFIKNISPSNFNVQNLVLAAFENMAEVYNQYKLKLMNTSVMPKRITFSGGLILKQPVLEEMICKKLGIPAKVSESDATVYNGMFKISQVCAGISDNLVNVENLYLA